MAASLHYTGRVQSGPADDDILAIAEETSHSTQHATGAFFYSHYDEKFLSSLERFHVAGTPVDSFHHFNLIGNAVNVGNIVVPHEDITESAYVAAQSETHPLTDFFNPVAFFNSQDRGSKENSNPLFAFVHDESKPLTPSSIFIAHSIRNHTCNKPMPVLFDSGSTFFVPLPLNKPIVDNTLAGTITSFGSVHLRM
jgi:hypothetical protein